MSYNRTEWVDNSSSTPVNASNLNNIEEGIVDCDNRITTNTSAIAGLVTDITDANTAIASNITAITAINSTINDAIRIRTGSFSGTWSPTLSSTFSMADYNNYNWFVTATQTERTTLNGNDIVSTAEVTGDTINFVSTYNGAAIPSVYVLVGVKKTVSNIAVVNQ